MKFCDKDHVYFGNHCQVCKHEEIDELLTSYAVDDVTTAMEVLAEERGEGGKIISYRGYIGFQNVKPLTTRRRAA